jgi:hypothetical protein
MVNLHERFAPIFCDIKWLGFITPSDRSDDGESHVAACAKA